MGVLYTQALNSADCVGVMRTLLNKSAMTWWDVAPTCPCLSSYSPLSKMCQILCLVAHVKYIYTYIYIDRYRYI